MKYILFSIIAILSSNPLMAQAQNSSTSSSESSDPVATTILQKIKKQYLSYSSLEIDFTLSIAFPEEEEEEIQKGTIIQKGEKYRMTMGNQEIISDGKALWLYLKDRNEVQINDLEQDDEEMNILSPNDLFTLYEKGEYLYAITHEGKEGNTHIQQIEFKPTDRLSEYSKLRLTLEKSTHKVLRMEVFSKDGSRFTLHIDKLKPNQAYEDNFFIFDAQKHPNVHIEDLRK